MIIHANDSGGRWRRLQAHFRQMFPAPFGLHTRHMFSAYLRDTLLVLGGVMIVALSIDLTANLFDVIAANSDGSLLGKTLYLGWYILLRCVYFATELLPMATFLGVFWAEVTHTRSKNRLTVLIAGRSPSQCLTPIILFAFLVASVQLALNIYLRPVAVMTQIEANLGLYGKIFDRRPSTKRKWIRTSDALINARIEFTSPPMLHDLQVYRVGDDRRLHEVLEAKSAIPIAGEKKWLLRDGKRWVIAPRPASNIIGPPQPQEISILDEEKFAREEIALDVDPLWLRYFGVDVAYLPESVFRALGTVKFYPDSEYRTWAQARYALAVGAGGMAILAGGLSLLLLINGILLRSLVVIWTVGFAAHLLTKPLLQLGFHGWIDPVLAAWFTPILILLGPLVVYQAMKMRTPAIRSQRALDYGPVFHQRENPAPR